MDELEHPLGAPQVLEAVLAQIAKGRALRQVVDDQRRRRCGQQHLAAVARRHDPRGPIQRRTEEVPVPPSRLSYMKGHPDTKGSSFTPRRTREPVLRIEARADSVPGGAEDGHHSVARALHHLPARAFHCCSQDGVVELEGLSHRPAKPLPEPRAPFDVGEQERERL
jgi:hypothetical protein